MHMRLIILISVGVSGLRLNAHAPVAHHPAKTTEAANGVAVQREHLSIETRKKLFE